MTAIRPADPVVASPRLRNAIRWTGAAFAIATLVGGSFTLLTKFAYDQRTESTVYTAVDLSAVERLTIDNSAGHTVVRAAPGGGARITTDLGDGLLRSRQGHEIVGDRLRVWGSCPAGLVTRCHVHHEIDAPDGLGVELSGQRGRIDVIGMSGALHLDGRFGTMTVDSASGPVLIEHQFGALVASNLRSASVEVTHRFGETALSFAEPPTEVRVSTHFGAVVIEVPDDGTVYRISGATEFGKRAVGVRSDPGAARVIHLETTFGDATIRYAR